MSITNHLAIILGKAKDAQSRANLTVNFIERIQTLENNGDLTPAIEAELLPHIEILEAATVPGSSEYANLDSALSGIKGILAENE